MEINEREGFAGERGESEGEAEREGEQVEQGA